MTSFGVDANSVLDTSDFDVQIFTLEYRARSAEFMLETLRKAGVRINLDGSVELNPDMLQIEPDFYGTFDRLIDKNGLANGLGISSVEGGGVMSLGMSEIEEKIYDYICEHEAENVDEIDIAWALDLDAMVVRDACEKLVDEGLLCREERTDD